MSKIIAETAMLEENVVSPLFINSLN
jgi:hypothetical protein